MSRKRLISGGVVLSFGSAFSALSSFLRNIIIARFVSVEDFGIVALFALTMSAIEMISNLAIDKVIIQAKDGNSRIFQATGHSFLIARGFASGVILYLAAEYVAQFFNIPQAVWAFQIIAVVPVIRGFMHLDLARFQREMKFTPMVVAESVSQLVVLIVALPLVIAVSSYDVIIWLILLQTSICVLLSHFMAERKYSLAWDYNIFSRMYKFGWPLLINGGLMFAILQGDKAIVGAAYSMEVLGWYSAAFILTLSPAMIITKVVHSLLLPWIKTVSHNNSLVSERSISAMHVCLLSGLIVSLFFSQFGYELLLLIFGAQYKNGAELVAILAFMQFIRIAKAGPIIVAMSFGDTKNPMYSNIARGVAFLVSIYLALQEYDIIAIIYSALLGEIVAYFVSMRLLSASNRIPLKNIILPVFSCLALAVLTILTCGYFKPIYGHNIYVVTVIISLVGLFVCIYTMPSIKRNIYSLIPRHL